MREGGESWSEEALQVTLFITEHKQLSFLPVYLFIVKLTNQAVVVLKYTHI